MAQIEEVSIDQFKHLVSERALTGETTSLIGETSDGSLAVLVALPIQALKRIEGALLISTNADDIDD